MDATKAQQSVSLATRDEYEIRRCRDIVSLLARRAELRGIHGMADLVDDAVRWSA